MPCFSTALGDSVTRRRPTHYAMFANIGYLSRIDLQRPNTEARGPAMTILTWYGDARGEENGRDGDGQQ